MLPTDPQLLRDVREELGSDCAVDAAAIHVAVQDGVVVLSGSIANVAAKQAVLSAARRVLGARRIFESIAVKPADPALDDTAIAARVRTILKLDAAVPEDAVGVAVKNGRVVLTGEVNWPYEREAARTAAARIAGVVSVNCRIEALGPPTIADLRGRILVALEAAIEAETAILEIAIDNGVVQLDGSLGGAAYRDAAERAVREAPGVARVENRLVAT